MIEQLAVVMFAFVSVFGVAPLLLWVRTRRVRLRAPQQVAAGQAGLVAGRVPSPGGPAVAVHHAGLYVPAGKPPAPPRSTIYSARPTTEPRSRGPRLPERVVVRCEWHESLFHGWCGPSPERATLAVRGAALRGGLHGATETEGQDAVGATWNPRTGTLYLAVADGLGSLPQSGPMAYEAVRAALHLCVTKPEHLSFEQAGERFFGVVAQGLRRSFGDRIELEGGTTLVVAEVAPNEDGASVTVHGVGDSEAWTLDAGGWSHLHRELGGTDATGYEVNATRDLPTDPRQQTANRQLARGAVLLLATDGFASGLGGTSRWPLMLAECWRQPPRPLDFLRHVDEVGDELSDDRGAVAVWIC
jgi:hypothetical protein